MTYEKQKNKVAINRSFLWTVILAAFSLGVFAGSSAMGVLSFFQPHRSLLLSETEGAFKFIRAQTDPAAGQAPRSNRELAPFRYKVRGLIDEKLKEKEAAGISVYFLDLNSGNWFGIGERENFSPYHHLKLPLMIAYFKLAESNPLVLRKTLTYNGEQIQVEQKHIKPLEKLVAGKRYTVNDLIFRMIAYDDGAAYALLFANIPRSRLDKVFKDLNVEYDPHNAEDTLSLRAFASFYRVLFNASYLSEEMSEKALRYLSKSSFKDGMASGISMNINIASKFGERRVNAVVENGTDVELEQLHEFGIIYHPYRPFLVGIMARGSDFNTLIGTIRDITRLVYDEVDRQS